MALASEYYKEKIDFADFHAKFDAFCAPVPILLSFIVPKFQVRISAEKLKKIDVLILSIG